MDRINYQHLYYFWMVAKQGSITAACDILHLAQPTISGQLAVFEQSVGTKLLRKEGRRLVLTETGRAVFHYAEEIFALGYDDADCIMAMEEAISLNVYSYSIIKGTITNHKSIKQEELNLFNIKLPQANIKRDLGDYKL